MDKHKICNIFVHVNFTKNSCRKKVVEHVNELFFFFYTFYSGTKRNGDMIRLVLIDAPRHLDMCGGRFGSL